MKHFLLLSMALLLLAGCGKSENSSTAGSSTKQTTGKMVDKTTAGAVSGTVSFKGAAPKMEMLDLSSDPACPADPQPQDVVVIKNGELANVFIYIRGDLTQFSFPTPADPVVLDQKKCRYVPHVLGLMAGQQLKVLNDDNAEHNVHPMARNNGQWNESQMPHGAPLVKTFQHPEIMIPVRCDQHPWMEMYVNVLRHPYFAVSGDDGTFRINDLPPGDYTLAAIHEKFGEQTMKVTIAPRQTAKTDFVFSSNRK